MSVVSAERPPGGPDAGVSEVLGSILMVAITVAVAGAMGTLVYGAISAEETPRRASFAGSIQPNDGGWGTGDETITVTHKGGYSQHISSLVIVVEVAGTETRFAQDSGQPLDHGQQDAFDAGDREFSIGERWTSSSLTIDPLTQVSIRVVDGASAQTIWSSSSRSSALTSSFVQTPLGMVTGTASNDDAARSATDGDAAATLTEELTGTTSQTTDQFGSTSSGTATDPQLAESSPDDAYAKLDADTENVQVSDYTSGVGTITQVEIALEGHHNGATDQGDVDGVRLSHDQGSTNQLFTLTTSDTQHFLDVTSDKASWTWSDIQALAVETTCECRDHTNDAKIFRIDSLWVRVTATVDEHELETAAWTFDELGPTDTHRLEIRYVTNTEEDYEVQAWDGSSWSTTALLTRQSFHTISETLTEAQVQAGPQIRILDAADAEGVQGSVDLDYVRVVSS